MVHNKANKITKITPIKDIMKKLAILAVVAVVALVGLVSYNGKANVSEPKNNGQILADLKEGPGGTSRITNKKVD